MKRRREEKSNRNNKKKPSVVKNYTNLKIQQSPPRAFVLESFERRCDKFGVEIVLGRECVGRSGNGNCRKCDKFQLQHRQLAIAATTIAAQINKLQATDKRDFQRAQAALCQLQLRGTSSLLRRTSDCVCACVACAIGMFMVKSRKVATNERQKAKKQKPNENLFHFHGKTIRIVKMHEKTQTHIFTVCQISKAHACRANKKGEKNNRL